ncbi:MAG: ABC-F family ATP-binding cassette domain-containing protein [Candidatus Korobacteraceae bacterium]|jgi:ATP-binding cassette subfamily F protein 3
MIQLSGAGKRFGPKILFENLDWLITPQDRVGLVGANGSGKSTLLKVLAGPESLDYGSITRARGITAGYLPQDGLQLAGRSVFDECLSVFDELHEMHREMEELAQRMGELDLADGEYAQIGDRFQSLEGTIRAREGYAIEAQVGTVLAGLGFRKEDWPRRTEEFSGGWQMRIALAKLLLEKPNLLLLDEPTNHLDLETRNWLEDYLRNYPYAYVVISHDRYFLDVTVNKTLEIWNRGVHFYSGNYEKYLREKQQRRDSLESAYRNQRERIEQLEAFITRFRYQATKAKQVQSRIKELERMERIEVPQEERTIHFTFPQPKPSGRVVADFKDVTKRYGEKEVFADVSFIVERGDRIALVGVNGAGKSTLIKLLGDLEPLSGGEYHVGHNVEIDYFAQDQYKELNPEACMIDDLGRVAPQKTQSELRTLLGSFLFPADEVFKRIGVLSGGERNRYALARMLLQPSNFLLLDEPTNHLDLRAKDVLLEALEKFTGTVVFVSHDRYFIDNLATRVFEVADGGVHVFPGNYEDYLWRKQQQAQAAATANDGPAKSASADTNGETKQAEPLEPRKRVNPIKLRQMAERCHELEEAIARVEAEIADAEQSLTVFVSADETQRVVELLAGKRGELEALVAEWSEVSHFIESNT